MIKDFALDLKSTRRKSGLTQKDCAYLLGVSNASMSHLENGVRMPKLREICGLSILYGKSFESLFGSLFDEIRADLSMNLLSMPKQVDGWLETSPRGQTLRKLQERLDAPSAFRDDS